MKTTKLTLTAVFSLLLALPAFADDGGSTGADGSTAVVRGQPSISANTPDCTDCVIRTVAKGDIGLSNGTYTDTTQTPATKAAPVSGAGSNQ